MRSIWIAVVSEIWSHRNKILFKGGVLDYYEIFSLAQLKVWSWITSKFPSAVSLILIDALFLWIALFRFSCCVVVVFGRASFELLVGRCVM